MIFGRTDLRKGESGAKFDAEADFEVRLAAAPQKLGQNSEKLNFPTQQIFNFFFSASKNEMSGIVWNAFWQSLRPNGAEFEEYKQSFEVLNKKI